MEYAVHPKSSYYTDATYSGKPPDASWPFHSVGNPKEILVPRSETCRKISFLLGKVDEQGEYSFADAAHTLPAVPGFTVKGQGAVPLPLCRELEHKLVSQALEETTNVWTLAPDLVQMQNPLWDVEMATLSASCAQRLGFKGVTLQPELAKVLLIAAGGQVDKQQGALFERCVATLVVQLPSQFTGGDLVVYEEEVRSEMRYNLGKEDGKAPFQPHCAVYAAGACCAVEQVTSGYCLMMIYSLWLPPGMVVTCGHANRNLIRLQLSESFKLLKGGPDEENLNENTQEETGGQLEDSRLALMLSKTCKQSDMESAGVNALFGVDRNRFQFLSEANVFLEPGKKLVFYLTRLRYRTSVIVEKNGSKVEKVVQEMAWYSISGAKIDDGNLHEVEWTTKLNFLNPAHETLSELWENGITSERFALIGWPVSADIVSSLSLFGEVSSVPVILAHTFISATTIRMLLSMPLDREGSDPVQTMRGVEKSRVFGELLPLCRKLGAAIVEVGNSSLVDAFFLKFVAKLTYKDQQVFLQWVPTLVKAFGWENVSTGVMTVVNMHSNETRLDRALELAGALDDNAAALPPLVAFAVKKAHSWCSVHPDAFVLSGKIVTLVKYVMASRNPQLFASLSAMLNKIDGRLLHIVLDGFSKYVHSSSPPEQRAMLASLAARRRDWLLAEIEDSKQPLSWEIPDMNFPNADEIALFLKGPGASFAIPGFSGINDARKRAKLLDKKIKGSVKVTAEGRGKAACVQIRKVGGDFDMRRKDVPKYQSEADRLGQIAEDMLPQDENTNTFNVGNSGRKRLRDDESDNE